MFPVSSRFKSNNYVWPPAESLSITQGRYCEWLVVCKKRRFCEELPLSLYVLKLVLCLLEKEIRLSEFMKTVSLYHIIIVWCFFECAVGYVVNVSLSDSLVLFILLWLYKHHPNVTECQEQTGISHKKDDRHQKSGLSVFVSLGTFMFVPLFNNSVNVCYLPWTRQNGSKIPIVLLLLRIIISLMNITAVLATKNKIYQHSNFPLTSALKYKHSFVVKLDGKHLLHRNIIP